MQTLFCSRCLIFAIAGSTLLTLASCRSTSPDTDVTPQPSESVAPPTNDVSSPPPPPTNSYLAQLPPNVTNELVSLDINIAIPTYLPSTMTLANYGIGSEETDYYWLVYRDDQDRCFAIEYAAGDTDDISLENQEPLNSTVFGEHYSLHHGKFPNGGDGELPESDLFTDWLEGEDGFYRLVGAGLVNAQDYGQNDCNNIAVKEAISIAESLSYLPTDLRTLEPLPPKSESSDD